jgi:hypothetical protein
MTILNFDSSGGVLNMGDRKKKKKGKRHTPERNPFLRLSSLFFLNFFENVMDRNTTGLYETLGISKAATSEEIKKVKETRTLE